MIDSFDLLSLIDYSHTKYEGKRLPAGERILYAGVIYESTHDLSCRGCDLGKIIKPRFLGSRCAFEECNMSTVLPTMYGFRRVENG